MRRQIVHDPLNPQHTTTAERDRNNKPTPRKRRSPLALMTGWFAVFLGLIALAGVAGVLALLYGEQGYEGRIYPNVRVRGFNVGFYHTTTANTALENHYANYLEHPIKLTYDGLEWYPSAEQLGLHLDIDAALEQAVTLGRTDTHMDSARTVLAIWDHGAEVPMPIQIDQQTAQEYLLEVAQSIERRPRNADIALDGADIIITPEQFGVQVLIDETLRDITAALHSLEPQQVNIRTRPLVPVVRNTEVAPLIDDLNTMLNGPIILTSEDGRCAHGCHWQWPPEQIARWIHLQRTMTPEGHPNIDIIVDQAAIQQAIVPIATTLQINGSLPRVDWNGGSLRIMQQGAPGRGLDAIGTRALVNEALQGGTRAIQLPMTDTPPPVIQSNLASLGITDVVGVGVSSFRASQAYRITNIRAGAWRMNGVLIPPGGYFSFNESLGPVTASNGFVQGAAIVQNRTQQEWGGGLCQVSTTMYRAAFWAGLPIVERHEHTFRINWYEELGEPPGMDAAIFTGVADLQFRNDTDGWLLTQAFVDLSRQRLTIVLYGSPSDRQVNMSYQILSRTPPPRQPLYLDTSSLPAGTLKQTDWARGGMHVQVYRTVTEGGQTLHQDTFDTVFEPWPNIYLRGTAGR